MVPASIQNNLAGLRTRERLLTLIWGAACWASIVLVLLLLCGLIDWLIDRQRETPMSVRVGMFFVQAGIAGVAGLLFVLWPQIRRLPDALLALWVEEKMPQFEHRLISAVQLNQPNADLQGMSKELVAVVTREAEKKAGKVGGFAQVADHGRLKWTGCVLLPVLLVFALPFAIWPATAFALLGRQAMLDIEIPHSVKLVAVSGEYWPTGEAIPVFIRVTGEYDETMKGSVFARPEGDAGDNYPLEYYSTDDDGAIFLAKVKASSAKKITYSARLADGRTRAPSEMKLVPRPTVSEKDSVVWVRLPAYCGLKPMRAGRSVEDRRYEVQQEGRGDIAGINGSSVRVQFEVANPNHKAWLVLLAPTKFNPSHNYDEATALEKDKRTIPMEIKKGKKSVWDVSSDGKRTPTQIDIDVADASFDLTPDLTGYRMIVENEYGFRNVPVPRRKLMMTGEETPTVKLLHDSFSDFEGKDLVLEGGEFAVPFDESLKVYGKIRIPYECYGRYGLGEARLYYRVLKTPDSGNDPMDEESWNRLTLPRVEANPDDGDFDLTTGVFQKTPFKKAVAFHAVPAVDPEVMLGRTRGGGRYFLATKDLFIGGKAKLKAGDHIEYYVEVFAANFEGRRTPQQMPPPSTRCETRVTRVMAVGDFLAFEENVKKERGKVKELEKIQTGVFGLGPR